MTDPRAALRDLAGDYTHLHDRCHGREAALAGLLREAGELIHSLDIGSLSPAEAGPYATALLRRIDAATTDNAREGQ